MLRTSRFSLALLALSLALGLCGTALLWWAPATAHAAEAATAGRTAVDGSWAFIAAAAATGLAALGAGFAVARVGTAAVGALAEKPELFGRLLIFIGLAEGIAIYGLIVAILILNRLG
jgi:V/A-type H+-transporting ATPase subunit K